MRDWKADGAAVCGNAGECLTDPPMEEYESQTEPVEEHLHHHAEHSPEKWVMGVALTAALLAALAAVAALLSGHYVDDAMLDRIKSSDHWSEFQAKGIKAAIVSSRIDAQAMHDKPADVKDRQRIERYEEEQKEIRLKAEEEEKGPTCTSSATRSSRGR